MERGTMVLLSVQSQQYATAVPKNYANARKCTEKTTSNKL